jgi:hypothetical protein
MHPQGIRSRAIDTHIFFVRGTLKTVAPDRNPAMLRTTMDRARWREVASEFCA